MSILETIRCHDDLLRLSEEEQKLLCAEIRDFLVMNVAKTGGHLASNLGVVELTVALETVFNTEVDRLVFDVGHQSYVHKMLTGRQADFAHLRQFGGMSGFPKPSESNTDAFVAGHASSSVSIALGMARARTLQKKDYHVVAVLGDGAATGGMIYEGLNDAAFSKEPLIIILNDNAMSIDRNVGGLSHHLSNLRSKEEYLATKRWYRDLMQKIPGGKYIYRATKHVKDSIKRMILPNTMFENMGLTYLGPVDGHDLKRLIQLLRTARDIHAPVLVHIMTRKGCGYLKAEEDPAKFHGIGKFDPITGQTLGAKKPTFSQSFGETMVELGERNSRVCAITAAMPGGTGLIPFKEKFPHRTFDVGIAEEHAVSMAGGLAKGGMIPVVALYSTFLQRSFDQIMQDIGLLHLHVVLAIDRAGLVGDDGPTHHGVFDIGFLRQVPGMLILAPCCREEQRQMLRWAVEQYQGPVAIRYPRGGDGLCTEAQWNFHRAVPEGRAVIDYRGSRAALISYGTLMGNVRQAAELLEQSGIGVTLIRLQTLSVFPTEQLARSLEGISHVVIAEETCTGSGIREALAWELAQAGYRGNVHGIDLGTDFVPHGAVSELYRLSGLDAPSIAEYVEEVLADEG